MSHAGAKGFPIPPRELCAVCETHKARHEVGVRDDDKGSADPRAVVRVCDEGCAFLAVAALRGARNVEWRTR